MPVPFLDLKAQHAALEDELTEAFRAIVRGAAFVGGPEVEAFEREFAAFCHADGAVAVGSGTDALRNSARIRPRSRNGTDRSEKPPSAGVARVVVGDLVVGRGFHVVQDRLHVASGEHARDALRGDQPHLAQRADDRAGVRRRVGGVEQLVPGDQVARVLALLLLCGPHLATVGEPRRAAPRTRDVSS